MLTPQEAFLKAIQQQPEDDGPRLMYADWLEERGDPRGELLRVQCQLAHTPREADGWCSLRERERNLLAQHGAEWAGPLAPRLSKTPLFHRGFLRPEFCREAAWGKVVGQGSAKALALIDRFVTDPHLHEFLACVLHEVVLKEGEVTHPAALRLVDKLQELEHPLARLPLWRLDLEQPVPPLPYPVEEEPRREHRRPSRRTRPRAGEPQVLARRGHEPVTFRNLTTAEDASRIATAVKNWEKESNGEWEAGVFRASRPLHPDRLSLDLLEQLPADFPAITGASLVPPNQVWTSLFAAASSGGAYNAGNRGAYGRLEAWQSLAALLGVSWLEPLPILARKAQEAWWLEFRTDWFNDIAWDLGVLVIRPDRSTVAGLAATDTD